MIEPILTLAISVHSNPGVYALLMGSGLSRPAGIPTGWDVVLDLVRKVAMLTGEDCEPDPSAWYQAKYGEAPDYSKLLDYLAKSPPERQQLLRAYFEPTDDEREQGLKLPTLAHKAIADLVSRGYVRVIITTNFDRLMEQALEAVGVTPTIISSADQMSGALPLAHTRCTVIKIHGDYIDTRIKNTPDELTTYDPIMDQLLDRVFDEYGLIVCGWSAQWDPALRAAIERCPSRRFTTFWAARGRLVEEAQGIIAHRRAELVQIEGADTFFQELFEKVLALENISSRHPLSTATAVTTLKRYLPEERHKIRAHDLVMDEANRLRAELSETRFPLDGTNVTIEDIANRMREYVALSETLLALVINGCYWGEQQHESLWMKCTEMAADHTRLGRGVGAYMEMRDFPALLLMYGGGVAAIAARKYGNLAAVLARGNGHDISSNKEIPLALLLNADVIILPNVAQHIISPDKKNYTPVSDYLFQLLREPLRELIPREANYQESFDRFEYLWTLTYVDLREQLKSSRRWAIGRYLWRDVQHHEFDRTILAQLYEEMDTAGGWPGLQGGLFGGSQIRLRAAREKFDEALPKLRRSIGMWT